MPAALKQKRDALTEMVISRYTEEERERIEELAEEYDVSMARVVRVAVLQMFERLDSDPPSPSKKKRSKK